MNFQDIDNDHSDPQMCSMYATEIYLHLRMAEVGPVASVVNEMFAQRALRFQRLFSPHSQAPSLVVEVDRGPFQGFFQMTLIQFCFFRSKEGQQVASWSQCSRTSIPVCVEFLLTGLLRYDRCKMDLSYSSKLRVRIRCTVQITSGCTSVSIITAWYSCFSHDKYGIADAQGDCLMQVAEEYKLVPDTLYLTISYIDRFLSCNIVTRQRLQLLGVSCMLIAA